MDHETKGSVACAYERSVDFPGGTVHIVVDPSTGAVTVNGSPSVIVSMKCKLTSEGLKFSSEGNHEGCVYITTKDKVGRVAIFGTEEDESGKKQHTHPEFKLTLAMSSCNRPALEVEATRNDGTRGPLLLFGMLPLERISKAKV